MTLVPGLGMELPVFHHRIQARCRRRDLGTSYRPLRVTRAVLVAARAHPRKQRDEFITLIWHARQRYALEQAPSQNTTLPQTSSAAYAG